MNIQTLVSRLKPKNGRGVISVLLTLPAFFAIGLHIILVFDPTSLPAVPDLPTEEDSLLIWFGLLTILLYFAKLRLTMGVLCFCAAAANASIMRQWVSVRAYSRYDVGPWDLVTSETGLWYLAYIGLPLFLGIVWGKGQNRASLKEHLKQRARDGGFVWLLAVSGLVLAFIATQRPTVHDYAKQHADELDSLEKRLFAAASVITLNYMEAGPHYAPQLKSLTPAPIYISDNPYQSNVALIPIRPFQGGGWKAFANKWRHSLGVDPLTVLIANRHTEYKNYLAPYEPYKASLAPAWWLLYDDPKDCWTDDPLIRTWLVRPSDGRVLYQEAAPCSQLEENVRKHFSKMWTANTNGTFQFRPKK
jgi:hypothetical protein